MELVPGTHTNAATMQAAIKFARRCGKDPSVLAKDVPGFIVNRLGYAVYREALHLLEMGVADAATIDRSFRNSCGLWATVFGPFQWVDLTGGPTLYANCMERVLPTLSNATAPPESIRRLADSGASGIANGRGFYDYTPEQSKQADALFHEHAWTVRALLNKYSPLEDERAPPD
jgi:3-hydroxybutyryl-CoA dehydrogenase